MTNPTLSIILILIENLFTIKKDLTLKKKKLPYNTTKMETPIMEIMEVTIKMETTTVM